MKSNHFIFIGASLAVLGGFYSIWNSVHCEIYGSVLTLVGGIIAAVAGFLYCRVVRSNEEEYEEESILLLTNLKELIDQNAKLSMQIGQFNEQNGHSNNHCVVTPFIYPNGGLGFKAGNSGKNGLDNLAIEIIDLEKLVNVESLGTSTIEDFRLASNVIHIENIPQKGIILPETDTSLHGDQRSFDITINTQQGKITEFLRMFRIDEDWKSAIRIKNSAGHIIYEAISADINRENLEW